MSSLLCTPARIVPARPTATVALKVLSETFKLGLSMTCSKSGPGGDFLAKKSDVTHAKQEHLPELKDILLVEDEGFDARRLKATLTIILGRECNIRIAQTLNETVDTVREAAPDIIFLDDYLPPSDSALETIPLVRQAGFDGPIIVLSGEWDRERALLLRRAGANDSMHKDSINSVELGAMLVRAFASPS